MANKFFTNKTPFARETLTVSTSALKLSPTVYMKAQPSNQNGSKVLKASGAIIRVDTAGFGVRCTEDGTTPVATSVGEVIANTGTSPLPAGTVLEKTLESFGAIVAFQMIQEGASPAVVQVEYYR